MTTTVIRINIRFILAILVIIGALLSISNLKLFFSLSKQDVISTAASNSNKDSTLQIPKFMPLSQKQIIVQSNNKNTQDTRIDRNMSSDSQIRRHVVFIMTGAVRTLAKTHVTILHNLVMPLCPPTSCTSHLVAHLSYSDNRPSTGSGDPVGMAIPMNSSEILRVQSTLKKWLCSNAPNDYLNYTVVKTKNTVPPESFHFCHFVEPSYDIGSDDERNAMDALETDIMQRPFSQATTINSTVLVNRIRSLRYADPRRYSMWFSRFYAWKFVEAKLQNYSEFMFFRPDLLWYLPFMNHNFVQANPNPNIELKARDAWVHDSYYSAVPDTFAYLPNADVARDYFSIENLVHEDIACLGGPDFNTTIAKQRLMDKGIFINSRDLVTQETVTSWVVPWCADASSGWSEQILLRKFHRFSIQHRWMPAGTNIFRNYGPDCQPIQPSFLTGWAKHHASPLPILVCRMIHDRGVSEKDGHEIWNIIETVQPFRIYKSDDPTTCLAFVSRASNKQTEEQPCQQHPINMRQVFSSYSDTLNLHSLWDEGGKVELSISWTSLNPKWKKEYLSLYTNKTLLKRES